jgi:antirestriction protein
MFKDTLSYLKGLKRINFLKTLEESCRLSQDDHHELRTLEVAVQMFEDQLDAEYKAEQAFMERFEDHFMASMER